MKAILKENQPECFVYITLSRIEQKHQIDNIIQQNIFDYLLYRGVVRKNKNYRKLIQC